MSGYVGAMRYCGDENSEFGTDYLITFLPFFDNLELLP